MLPAPIALLGALALAPVADAQITEVGPTGTAATGTPSCPTNCIAVTRTTGYQQSVDGKVGAFRVPADGRIVAWTVTLGTPGKKQVKFFDDNYGGEAQAGIAVLKMGKKARATLQAQSPTVKLTPYFGQTVQFPLTETLPVEKNDIVALTVPTWAPALAAFRTLAELEGIIPALESSHAVAWVLAQAEGDLDLICLSGRGDKDLAEALERLGVQ